MRSGIGEGAGTGDGTKAEDAGRRQWEARWAAVVGRDCAFDAAFVYSVKTTGVYCRPTCPSRRPNPRNVAFHADWSAAEQAGFRACLRCRPKDAALAERRAAIVAKACRRIEAADELPGLGELAAEAGLSRFHFHRLFKSIVGLTPKAYGAARRARRVRAELAGDADRVTEAIYAAGFSSSSRFYEKSKEILGMTATAFHKGGDGAEIQFAIGECSLGSILVARSDKGVCAISLGDDPDELARDLQDRFPHANLIGDDPAFANLVAKVVGFVEAPALGLDLPLDLRGTAFQQRVWRALCQIPSGATTSYAEIARRIGAPKSVRAVASAIAANPIAVAIPCHRVVRADGSLSGYRWGVERKSALQKKEGQG